MEMNDGKPEWYIRLNENEKRIIDIFLETKCRFLIPRPELERRLCRTKLMNQRTLTDRLDYLIEKGYIGKIRGKKGAVFYAPGPVIDMILSGLVPTIETAIDTASPKSPVIYSMPVKPIFQNVSEAEMWGLLVRAGQTWEKVGVGSRREKEKVYRELQRLRKRRRATMGSKHAWKETSTERMLRSMRESDDRM
jgi:hypothetical protein